MIDRSRNTRVLLGRISLGCAFACFIAAAVNYSAPPAHASSKTERQQGATLFHEKGCEFCHGIDGIGTEKGPSLSGVGRLLHKPDIERQIHDGGKQMPSFADALTPDELHQIVEYLAAKKSKVKLKPAPAAMSADPG